MLENEQSNNKADNKANNKLLPTQYDLRRLEAELSSKEKITAVFRPIDKTWMSANGTFSGVRINRHGKKHNPDLNFTGEIIRLKGNVPDSLKSKTKFIPDLRLTLVGESSAIPTGTALKFFANNLVSINSIVSKDYFVLQDLFPFRKKQIVKHKNLMESFLSEVRESYPNAKAGFECGSSDYSKFPDIKKEFDFVILRSQVKSENGKAILKASVTTAKQDALEVFCLGASIFIGNGLFAPTLVPEPIVGFSFYHGNRPYKRGKSYYNVQKSTVLPGEKSPTRYWTQEAMEDEYGSDTSLSTVCPCNICSTKTIKSFFSQDEGDAAQFNLKHKSLFVEIKANEQAVTHAQYVAEGISLINPHLETLTEELEVASSIAAWAPQDTVPSGFNTIEEKILHLVKSIDKGDAFLNRIAEAVYRNSKHFKSEFMNAIKNLLQTSEIKYNVDKTSNKIFFTLT